MSLRDIERREGLTDILETINKLYEWTRAHPVPQSIWFIDRAQEFFTLLDAIPTHESNPFSLDRPTLGGVPVQRWTSRAIRDRMEELLKDPMWSIERVRYVLPFCQPGIWLQWSNGKHQHIELKDNPTDL